LISLFLACLVWLYVRGRDQDSLDNIPVPVQITLAPAQADLYDLDVPDPCQVTASFYGSPSRIRELRSMIHHGELRAEIALTVPENLQNESPYLDTVRVEASDLHPPQGVTPIVIEGRNRIPVTLHRLVERRLPVRFNHLLEDRLGQVTIEPATVLVRGPREILDRAREIATQPYALPPGNDKGASQETAAEGVIGLAREIDGRPVKAIPDTVYVRFTIRPRQKIYELNDVPVQFLCPADFGLRPQFTDERAAKISLRLQGPASEETPAVVVYVDLTSRKLEPGLYADEPLRLQLPKDFQLAQKPPRSASFKLVPVETATKGQGNLRNAERVPPNE
jgi:hypothetical protein